VHEDADRRRGRDEDLGFDATAVIDNKFCHDGQDVVLPLEPNNSACCAVGNAALHACVGANEDRHANSNIKHAGSVACLLLGDIDVPLVLCLSDGLLFERDGSHDAIDWRVVGVGRVDGYSNGIEGHATLVVGKHSQQRIVERGATPG
jgi:hypothetical protein